MKQVYLLFILLNFVLSSLILGSADIYNSNSGNFHLTDDKEKNPEEINKKPKEENAQEKPEAAKDKSKSKKPKGYGGNRYIGNKDKDKK